MKINYSMKQLLFLFIILLSFSCDRDTERFRETCPYDFELGGRHMLRAPITVAPHQMTYQVGDTITFSYDFSDMIEDISAQQVFKIQDFPFRPTPLLYRVTDLDRHDSGFRFNDVIIDEDKVLSTREDSRFADNFTTSIEYMNGQYFLEWKLVAKEPGRYLTFHGDFSNITTGEFHDNEGEKFLENIDFEGKCPTLSLWICNMLQGDDHRDEFIPELRYLDREVYNDGVGTLSEDKPLGDGSLSLVLEIAGFYGFEIVE